MRLMYIEKMDKPRWGRIKIKIENENCKLYANLEKEKNIKKVINKLVKNDVVNVVLSKELYKNKNFINAINASNINIFDGRWLEKYLSIKILDFIVQQKKWKKEEIEIAITVNQITDLSIEIIKILAKQYKRVTVVTKHLEKLKKVEQEIYDREGVIIIVANNQKKSLVRADLILNIDFNKELINKYKINENACIVNLEGDIQIDAKRFNGINVNDYEIEVGREEIIWRPNMKEFRTKDLFEAVLYMKDTFESISIKINKNKVKIKELYGVNGKIIIK